MNSQFRFETIIQSCLYYSDIGHEQPFLILKPLYNRAYTILISSVYRIYIYMNRHSDSSGKIEFPIFVNSRHKIAFESDKNNPKSPRLYENRLYDFKAIFLHSTCE